MKSLYLAEAGASIRYYDFPGEGGSPEVHTILSIPCTDPILTLFEHYTNTARALYFPGGMGPTEVHIIQTLL
jgi:hypothetical protein